MFQSTHPHGVRQSQIEFYVELTKVSIHAPTRGATHPEFQKNVDDLVSIHAPTRGATVLSRSGIRPMVSFNPRTHTGCDLGNTHKRFGYCVSIHAPTRGATKPKTFRYFVPRGFNPRTHTGCDIIYVQGHDLHVCFNPRTHTGCDLRISRHRPSTVLSFQSTHPHGVRRYVIRRILRRAVVSIHAPTRGATHR